MDIRAKFDYDGNKAYEQYARFVDGEGDINDLLDYLQRHVIMRVRRSYLRQVGAEVCEDLVQSALIEVWRVIEGKKIPLKGVPLFHSFLNTVIRRRISKEFKKVYDDAPKELDPKIFRSTFMHRLPSSDVVETRIFLEELPDHLRRTILARLPFPDAERREGVAYVLDCVLKGKRVVPDRLRREFGVKNPEFLIEYTNICVRQELYDLRKDLPALQRSNTEKNDILAAGITECFGA